MRKLLIAAVAALAVPAGAVPAAVSFEAAKAAAGFEAGVPVRLQPPAPADSVPGSPNMGEGFQETVFVSLVTVRGYRSQPPFTVAVAAKGAVQEVDVAPLLNKQLKTSLTKTLAGAQVWISGVFDRDQKAFLSILEDGKAARFYDVETLLVPVKDIPIGTGKFRLKIAPDLGNQLDSEILLTNQADRSNWIVTLKEMLDAVSAAGHAVRVHGQDYRLFYYDDVKGGQVQPTRSFAFIMVDPQGELHIFLIPSELVPENQPAVFKMHQNKAVALQRVGGKLRITER